MKKLIGFSLVFFALLLTGSAFAQSKSASLEEIDWVEQKRDLSSLQEYMGEQISLAQLNGYIESISNPKLTKKGIEKAETVAKKLTGLSIFRQKEGDYIKEEKVVNKASVAEVYIGITVASALWFLGEFMMSPTLMVNTSLKETYWRAFKSGKKSSFFKKQFWTVVRKRASFFSFAGLATVGFVLSPLTASGGELGTDFYLPRETVIYSEMITENPFSFLSIPTDNLILTEEATRRVVLAIKGLELLNSN